MNKQIAVILFLSLCFLLGISSGVYAQIGGRHVYDFLNLMPSPRIAALGGAQISTLDDDVNLAQQNPALLNDSMARQLSLSYVNHLADIGYGYAAYAQPLKKLGIWHIGIQYVNYGNMQGADINGVLTGEFKPTEWAITVGHSRAWKQFRYGANLKFISSQIIDAFSSIGMASDLGLSYLGKNKLFSAGLSLRNLGFQITPYAESGGREPLPTEISIGFSNKLRYMPLRFTFTAVQLQQPQLVFTDPDAEQEFDLNGNLIENEASTVDKIFRHAVIGAEFLLGDALRIRGGYNHMRRQELRAENRGGFTGFSLGAGIRLRRLSFDYAYASYGLNSLFNTHHFGLRVNLNKNIPPKNIQGQENRATG